jgi:hypothetical protein
MVGVHNDMLQNVNSTKSAVPPTPVYRQEDKKLCFISLPQSQNINYKFICVLMNPVSHEYRAWNCKT